MSTYAVTYLRVDACEAFDSQTQQRPQAGKPETVVLRVPSVALLGTSESTRIQYRAGVSVEMLDLALRNIARRNAA